VPSTAYYFAHFLSYAFEVFSHAVQAEFVTIVPVYFLLSAWYTRVPISMGTSGMPDFQKTLQDLNEFFAKKESKFFSLPVDGPRTTGSLTDFPF
jgi:hypothetical protein